MTAQKLLGRNINRLRTQKRLTQSILADLAMVSLRHLQRIESGEVAPTIEAIVKLKRILKCDWNTLLKEVE